MNSSLARALAGTFEAKPQFTVRVTRKEFLALPIRIRRRALRDMAKDKKLQQYYDMLDCEEEDEP